VRKGAGRYIRKEERDEEGVGREKGREEEEAKDG